MKDGWIGVDLDATLAKYDGWKGVEHIGEPIPAMVDRVKRWLAEGKQVRIMTARVFCPERHTYENTVDGYELWRYRAEEVERARYFINLWCATNIGQYLPITCTKDFGMVELWDDRCVRVVPNTGVPCCQQHER